VVARFPADAPLIGAVALAVDAVPPAARARAGHSAAPIAAAPDSSAAIGGTSSPRFAFPCN
jgi:hypothetical protein